MHSAIKSESSTLKSNLRRKNTTTPPGETLSLQSDPFISRYSLSLLPCLSVSISPILSFSLSLLLFQSPSTLRPSLSKGGNVALSLYT